MCQPPRCSVGELNSALVPTLLCPLGLAPPLPSSTLQITISAAFNLTSQSGVPRASHPVQEQRATTRQNFKSIGTTGNYSNLSEFMQPMHSQRSNNSWESFRVFLYFPGAPMYWLQQLLPQAVQLSYIAKKKKKKEYKKKTKQTSLYFPWLSPMLLWHTLLSPHVPQSTVFLLDVWTA